MVPEGIANLHQATIGAELVDLAVGKVDLVAARDGAQAEVGAVAGESGGATVGRIVGMKRLVELMTRAVGRNVAACASLRPGSGLVPVLTQRQAPSEAGERSAHGQRLRVEPILDRCVVPELAVVVQRQPI